MRHTLKGCTWVTKLRSQEEQDRARRRKGGEFRGGGWLMGWRDFIERKRRLQLRWGRNHDGGEEAEGGGELGKTIDKRTNPPGSTWDSVTADSDLSAYVDRPRNRPPAYSMFATQFFSIILVNTRDVHGTHGLCEKYLYVISCRCIRRYKAADLIFDKVLFSIECIFNRVAKNYGVKSKK